VRKFASLCGDDDGRVIKSDTAKSEWGFCQVSGEKKSSFGILWFDDSLCPCSKPGVFLFEYLYCEANSDWQKSLPPPVCSWYPTDGALLVVPLKNLSRKLSLMIVK
jgi:hypothetical protein